MSDEILTAEQVAKRLNVKTTTIKIWARKGIIPALRPTPKIPSDRLPIFRIDLKDARSVIDSILEDSP